MSAQPFMGLEDAAAWICAEPEWLRCKASEGHVRATKIGKRWVFHQDHLRAFYERLCDGDGAPWVSIGARAVASGTSASGEALTDPAARLHALRP